MEVRFSIQLVRVSNRVIDHNVVRCTLEVSVTYAELATDLICHHNASTLSKFFNRSIILPSTSSFDRPADEA